MSSANRVTGLQAAQVSLSAQLHGYREQFTPREYAVLLDLLLRLFDRERCRHTRALRRWAA